MDNYGWRSNYINCLMNHFLDLRLKHSYVTDISYISLTGYTKGVVHKIK